MIRQMWRRFTELFMNTGKEAEANQERSDAFQWGVCAVHFSYRKRSDAMFIGIYRETISILPIRSYSQTSLPSAMPETTLNR